MAIPSLPLIHALRNASQKLEASTEYQWGHMGACNCGFLAQEITKLTKDEIHRHAMARQGDWSEQLNDYCPTSGLLMDDTIKDLMAIGFTSDDLRNLERLSDLRILRALPEGEQLLYFNHKSDAVKYMKAWANLLEAELLENIEIPDYHKTTLALAPG